MDIKRRRRGEREIVVVVVVDGVTLIRNKPTLWL